MSKEELERKQWLFDNPFYCWWTSKENEIKSNRDKKLAPKLGKFWCGKCDACKVGKGSKCKLCGFKQIKRKLKK